MEQQQIEILDVVALLEAIPSNGLVRGQVGTIVERLDDDAYEVEFSDEHGRTFATAALRDHQLMRLYHKPVQAA